MNDLFQRYGVLFVFLNVLLEQIGLPVPAFPTLIVAGTLALHQGGVLARLFAVGAIACVLADLGWFAAGRLYGNRVMRFLCRISLNPDSCVSQTQLRFERWGPGSLVIAKFVPGLATIAPPLAGATRMGVGRFILYSTAGTLLWVSAGLAAGIWLGPQMAQLWPQLRHLGRVFAALLVLVAFIYIVYKYLQRRRFFATLRMARISVAELYELIDSGAAPLIVDVRSLTAQQLEPRRIPGAITVTLQSVSEHLKELPSDRDIVLYCTCPNEASAARVAKVLMNHGFLRVRPLLGGLEAWVAAGYQAEPLALSGATAIISVSSP